MASATQKIHLTPQGKHKYEEDLTRLYHYLQKVVGRMRSLRRRSNIDEDADWAHTMNEYEYATKRIDELEHVLENARVIKTHGSRGRIGLGSTVRCKNTTKTHVFTLVDPVEANPEEGKISVKSPLGEALLGKSVDEEIYFDSPSGPVHYTVQEVS